MVTTLLKACGVWVLLVLLAILNGTVQERLLVPWLGAQWALPLSGIPLSVLILVATLLLLPFLGILSPSSLLKDGHIPVPSPRAQYWLVGGMWLLLTILFEFLFGHYVLGEPWTKLLEAYNIRKGNLWVLVLLVTAAAPYLAARLRGFI
jgi:hypothetical protein